MSSLATMGRRKQKQICYMIVCLLVAGILLILMTRHVCIVSEEHKHCW